MTTGDALCRLALLLSLPAGLLGACSDDAATPADGGGDAGTDAGTNAPDAGAPDAGPALLRASDERVPCADHDPSRRVLFGDLHVHTALSYDAAGVGTRLRPRDAYAFARGQEVGLPPYDGAGEPTRSARLARPLDFAAVTDHAEYFAETGLCTDPASPVYGSTTCVGLREDPSFGEFPLATISTSPRHLRICREQPQACADALADGWRETIDAAEAADDETAACELAAFVAYEWSGTPGGNNLHRNVIFATATVPAVPASYIETPTPTQLWDALEAVCLSDPDCDALAIPHNSNLAGGLMFAPTDDDGAPYTREQAARRARMEPLIELYQHKGASECLSGVTDPLASEDERCAFERIPRVVCSGAPDDPEGCAGLCSEGAGPGFLSGCVEPRDYARGALRTGLAERARIGDNPFAFGFIASTDSHNGTAGATEESAFAGHFGEADAAPAELLDPEGPLGRGLGASAGGLAAVWAEERSRPSIFAALRRRETYGTSGTRLVVRTFTGFDLPDSLCDEEAFAARGYELGVPMGGELSAAPDGAALRVAVSVMRDPRSAPIERVQLIEAWVDDAGATHERVHDVIVADETAPVGAGCELPTVGLEETCAVFTVPGFDRARPSLSYVRVLEQPTCRWSAHVCAGLEVDCGVVEADDPLASCCLPAEAHVTQERAWTSPVWYAP